jgi:hypothetical protein
VAGARPLVSPLVANGVRVMSTAEYLTWSVLAAICAAGSGQLFVVAERHRTVAQAWLAAIAFGLWSALAAVCFWEAV